MIFLLCPDKLSIAQERKGLKQKVPPRRTGEGLFMDSVRIRYVSGAHRFCCNRVPAEMQYPMGEK